VWAHRGSEIALYSEPGASARLVMDDSVDRTSIELPQQAAAELVNEVVSIYGHELLDRITGLEEALDATEHERDELRTVLKTAQTTERGLRADIERMRTAGGLADDLVRTLIAERDAALLRADEILACTACLPSDPCKVHS